MAVGAPERVNLNHHIEDLSQKLDMELGVVSHGM